MTEWSFDLETQPSTPSQSSYSYEVIPAGVYLSIVKDFKISPIKKVPQLLLSIVNDDYFNHQLSVFFEIFPPAFAAKQENDGKLLKKFLTICRAPFSIDEHDRKIKKETLKHILFKPIMAHIKVVRKKDGTDFNVCNDFSEKVRT